MEIEKERLKDMICEYIDKANLENIKFYEFSPMTQRINEFGNFIYVQSNRKEVKLELKLEG